MVELFEHQFYNIIQSTFDPLIRIYGFEIQEEDKNLLRAKRGDVEIIFRLEAAHLSYYLSTEIKLLGELGEKATGDSEYRHIGVGAIVKCLDPYYKRRVKKAQTEEDLIKIAEDSKEELLTYCRSILLGDITSWQGIVDCLKSEKV